MYGTGIAFERAGTFLSVYNSIAVVRRRVRRWSFYKRNVGERLVVYLAASDLLIGISHILDHAYMLATKDHPPVRRTLRRLLCSHVLNTLKSCFTLHFTRC